MTALSANLDLQTKDGVELEVPVMAAEIIYEGAPVYAKNSDGYAYSADGSTNTLTVGDLYVGICLEKCDNSAGAAGDKKVRVLIRGLVRLPISGTLTQAKLGDPVFANETSDDSTLTLTSDLTELETQVGVFCIHDTSSYGWVDVTKHSLTRVGWGAFTPVAGNEGYQHVHLLKFTYSFAVDGGAVGSITLGHVPSGALILGGVVDVRTALTGSGTGAVQIEGADDIIAAASVGGAPWSTTGRKAFASNVNFGTASVKTTAARNVVFAIASNTVTAGIFDVYLLVANV